jgi:hypothetical protein
LNLDGDAYRQRLEAPSYRQKEANTARIPGKIESDKTVNPHMGKARGLAGEGYEEQKYSVGRGFEDSSILSALGGFGGPLDTMLDDEQIRLWGELSLDGLAPYGGWVSSMETNSTGEGQYPCLPTGSISK